MLFESPNLRGDADREKIGAMLNQCLADLLALYAFAKLAHWNTRGPLFGSLHPLFGKIADSTADFADRVAERTAMLGVLAIGTPTQVTATSTLGEYPVDLSEGVDHARAVFDRLKALLLTLNTARTSADEIGGVDTFQLLTDAIIGLEQHGWMLVAHTQ